MYIIKNDNAYKMSLENKKIHVENAVFGITYDIRLYLFISY